MMRVGQEHTNAEAVGDSGEVDNPVTDHPLIEGDESNSDTSMKPSYETFEVKFKAKMFHDTKVRARKKAEKVNRYLRQLRPHIRHMVLYECSEAKKPLFQIKKNNDIKTGGCITVVPSLTTTKRRVRASSFHMI